MNSFVALSMLKFVILMNNLVRKQNLHLLDLKDFMTWISLRCQLSQAFELSDECESCVWDVECEKKLNKLK